VRLSCHRCCRLSGFAGLKGKCHWTEYWSHSARLGQHYLQKIDEAQSQHQAVTTVLRRCMCTLHRDKLNMATVLVHPPADRVRDTSENYDNLTYSPPEDSSLLYRVLPPVHKDRSATTLPPRGPCSVAALQTATPARDIARITVQFSCCL